jgi:Chromate transporter
VRPSVADLVRYFLVLGATGFGGPVALANAMRRDLVERRGWLDELAYERGLAILKTGFLVFGSARSSAQRTEAAFRNSGAA